MKIEYIIYNDWSEEQKIKLSSYGINVEVGYNRIELVESPENATVLRLLDDWGIQKFVGTTYDKKDFQNCSLLVYVGVWENGYPMPDNNREYINLTYNTDEYCEICGIGKKQKAPFRVKSEPRWGNKSMFELNWIYDEIFVRKDIYESLFKNAGLNCREVLLYKKEKVLENTVQLEIPKITIPLDIGNQPYKICEKCNRKKYSPQIRGFFPSFEQAITDLQMFKCSEYFGSGCEAHNKIFITRKLWEEIRLLKVKPNVWPVQSSN